MLKSLVLVTALAISGCATVGSGGTGSTSVAAQQAVFAAKTGYGLALSAAVAYESTPRCAQPVKQPCSDPQVVAQLRLAQPASRATLDAAETAVRSPILGVDAITKAVAAANSALAAFEALTKGL